MNYVSCSEIEVSKKLGVSSKIPPNTTKNDPKNEVKLIINQFLQRQVRPKIRVENINNITHEMK